MEGYVGTIVGAHLVVKKRQRPKGGAKNVYYLGMQRKFYDADARTLTGTLNHFGGETNGSPNNYIFTKRAQALKAWAWIVLKYA